MLHTEVTMPVTRSRAPRSRKLRNPGELPRRIQFRGNLEFVVDDAVDSRVDRMVEKWKNCKS